MKIFSRPAEIHEKVRYYSITRIFCWLCRAKVTQPCVRPRWIHSALFGFGHVQTIAFLLDLCLTLSLPHASHKRIRRAGTQEPPPNMNTSFPTSMGLPGLFVLEHVLTQKWDTIWRYLDNDLYCTFTTPLWIPRRFKPWYSRTHCALFKTPVTIFGVRPGVASKCLTNMSICVPVCGLKSSISIPQIFLREFFLLNGLNQIWGGAK